MLGHWACQTGLEACLTIRTKSSNYAWNSEISPIYRFMLIYADLWPVNGLEAVNVRPTGLARRPGKGLRPVLLIYADLCPFSRFMLIYALFRSFALVPCPVSLFWCRNAASRPHLADLCQKAASRPLFRSRTGS